MGATVGPRKPSETTSRAVPSGAPRAIRDAGVRAALRNRRQRRLEEAGMQSLVRALAVQMSSSGRGG